MTSNFYGVSSYQQTNQIYQNYQTDKTKNSSETEQSTTVAKSKNEIEVSEWKPIKMNSPLVPTTKAGYGTVIGDVSLSDQAKDYYDKLKSKFHGMDFILVSKDMKSQVAANAAAYGNANKPVVLIDDEKLERMATDEAYRKKYEGIIAMSQIKLQEAKNSLVSSGANVKNFGMSVSSDGKTSFFATIEKANEQQAKILEKKQAEKKAAKLKEKKKAEKEAVKERLEKLKENKNADKIEGKTENKAEDETESSLEGVIENKEYVEFKSDSVDALVSMVAKYAYASSLESVMTESESKVGQNIDFRG